MEQKIIILVDNQKSFQPKKKPISEEIRNFIKKEYNLEKESFIELYNNDFSKRIYSDRDLEKLKEKNDKFNEYIIRINFKSKNLSNTMVIMPSGLKNIINNNNEKKSSNKNINTFINKNNKANNITNIKINNTNSNKKINNITKNNLNENSNKKIELKKSFEKEKVKLNLNKEIEDEKFNEEVNSLKLKQQQEIESLEKEMNELKQINKNLDIDNDDNNILLNNDILEKLKFDIINEIKIKIKEELNDKIQDIDKNNEQNKLNKQNEDYINEAIKKEGLIIFNKLNPFFGEIMEKQKNLENKFNNIKNLAKNEVLEENKNPNQNQNKISHNKKVPRDKNPKPENYNNIQLYNNKDNEDKMNINNKDNNKDPINEENINDEEDMNINKLNNKIKNINAFNRQNPYLNNKNFPNNNPGKNNNYFGNLEKEQPKQIKNNNNINVQQNNNYNNNNPPLEKKNSKGLNLFPLFNSIFFVNPQQTIINSKKISEEKKIILINEHFKHINEENNIVTKYADTFIRANVLKIFNQANISRDTIEVVKYNISSVCECVGINRDHYVPYYFPRIHNPKKGYRRSSVEAAIRFRKEFGVSEQDINQEQLLKKLEENNDDINQTFQIIYG